MCRILMMILAVGAFSVPVMAEDAVSAPSHAMVMHGEAKYGEGFTHLEYVNPDAPKGGVLKQHVVGSFDSVNPFIVKGAPAAGLNYLGQTLIYDSLMEQSYDEPFTMYCLLCETVERDPSNMQVAFNLRKEAKWHDGVPVTADDVVFSFENFMAHGTPFFKAYYGDVKDVKAEGERRVVFTFKHDQNAELPMIIGQLSIIPKHYWNDPAHDFSKSTLEPPLSGGAYKIAEIEAGRKIVYERVADYWGRDLPINKGTYNFDRIEFDYYRDNNVALEAFFAGEYDVRIENTAKLWNNGYDAPPVKDGRIAKEELSHARPQGMQAFIYNTRRPVFQDIEVRKALAFGFDFEWSNKQFAYGKYTRSHSYFSNSELGSSGLPSGQELEILERYRDRIPAEVFGESYAPPVSDGSGKNRKNLRTGAKMLEEAGWVTGADGIRAKNGVRLSFEIVDSNPQFERWVLPFIKNLKRMGVEANFRVVDSTQYQNRINEFDFDMTISSFGQSSSPGNEQREFWGSEKAASPGSRNYIGVQDPVIDELIEELIQAEGREKLVAYTHALDRILLAGHYLIPQWYVDHWRIAWWKHLEKPAQLSPLTPAITKTWWSKNDKDAE